jgi:PAS domain S-box/diguanylate cyclase (GGDEF) domain
MADNVLDIVLESIAEGVYMVDRDRRITYWNSGAERITGYPKEKVIGSKCSDNLLRHVTADGQELCAEGCPLAACMCDGVNREAEVFLHHRDGHRVPVIVKAIPVTDEEGKPNGSIEVFADRSERSQLLSDLEALRKETLSDPLTGLGNRRFADLSLDKAIASADERENRGSLGLLMLDIDHFKNVNDTYGHQTGDRILRMVGWTLANAVRRMDAAARWGGEEFLVIAPGVDGKSLLEIAERARVLVGRSWLKLEDGRVATVTVSIGGALRRPRESAESLVARADARLYGCKSGGRNRCEIDDSRT